MYGLLTDRPVRTLAQAILGALFLALAVIAVGVLIVLASRLLGQVDGPWTDLAILTIQMLALPLEETPGQIVTVLVSVFPQAVAIVCFVVDPGPPPKAGSDRNALGTFCMFCLLVGFVCWAAILIIMSTNPALLEELSTPEGFALAKAAVSGLVSFQLIYFLKLAAPGAMP